jgi:hypothetical protein
MTDKTKQNKKTSEGIEGTSFTQCEILKGETDLGCAVGVKAWSLSRLIIYLACKKERGEQR